MADESPMQTEDYQRLVLKFMLHNSEFRETAGHHLKIEHFSTKVLQWFFTTMATSPHHLSPTLLQEEMVKAAKNNVIRADEFQPFIQQFQIISQNIPQHEQDHVKDQIGKFIKEQSVKNAMLYEIKPLAEQEKWDEIVDVMQEAVSAGFDLTDLGTDYFSELEARINTRSLETAVMRVPTGVPDLDTLTYGGLKKGQVGLLVGATGRGKTLWLQQFCRGALAMNKNVVYITLELREDDIAARFDAMLAAVKPSMLNAYQKELLDEIPHHCSMGQKLLVKHWPADSATVNTFKEYLRMLSSRGIVPDLVIVDYIDLVKSHKNYGDAYAEIDAITKALVGFASEFDIVLWTAAQMNRSGMVAENPDESGVAGAISKLFHVDLVVMLAQSKEEREDEIIHLDVVKNRNGKVGRITSGTDYGHMIAHDTTRVIDTPTDNTTKETNDHGPKTANKEHNMQLLRSQMDAQSSDGSD